MKRSAFLHIVQNRMLSKKGKKCYKAEFLNIVQEYHPDQHIKSPRKSNWSFLQKSVTNVLEIGHK